MASAGGLQCAKQGGRPFLRRSTGRDPARFLDGVTIQAVKQLCGMSSSSARSNRARTVGWSCPPGRNWNPGQKVPSLMICLPD